MNNNDSQEPQFKNSANDILKEFREKQQQKRQQEVDLAKSARKNQVPHCPRCKSKNIQAVGNHRKGFSVGKAVLGGVLVGGVGTLAGFVGKKGKKIDMICMDCGKKFKY
ncbi:hypothetical protein [Pediococcus parvulus]|uniref:hypothetical protein n=1 Tax=Pediococcus parvulus TaxID=54062 RepID=UPI00345E6813